MVALKKWRLTSNKRDLLHGKALDTDKLPPPSEKNSQKRRRTQTLRRTHRKQTPILHAHCALKPLLGGAIVTTEYAEPTAPLILLSLTRPRAR